MHNYKNHLQNGFSFLWIILLGIVIMSVAIVAITFLPSEKKSATVPTQTTINTNAQPAIKTTDLSQGAPENQKTAVVVEHSDSSYEKFILANTTVDGFVSHLPTGDKLVSKTPYK